MDSTVDRAHQNDTNLNRTRGGTIELHESAQCEPLNHAIGWSRGSLTVKTHAICDANPRPLILLLGPGQGGDSLICPEVLGQFAGAVRGRRSTSNDASSRPG